jgi:hypothetical protein
METIVRAEKGKGPNANIKVEKQKDGRLRVIIEDLSITGNMMDIEEGVLQQLNQAGSAIMKEALQHRDVEGDPLFCLESGRARANSQRHMKPVLGKQK